MKKLLLVIFLAILPVNALFAVKLASLYLAELPVAAQTEALRSAAIREGLLQVLTKVSSDPTLTSNPLIKDSLDRAEYYVAEYSYMTATTNEYEYILRVRFAKEDIDRLLAHAGVSFWGDNRPLILVWLVYQTGNNAPEIVSHDENLTLLRALKSGSKKFGIPMIFPAMDLADLNSIRIADIATLNMPALTQAAKRYEPDGLLIGMMQEDNNSIKNQWQLIINDKHWKFDFVDANQNKAILHLFTEVSHTLASNYAVKPAEVPVTWYNLSVSNVQQRKDLMRLTKYLQQLSPVQQVELAEVNGDVVELKVAIRGSLDAFLQNAVIGKHLQAKTRVEGDQTIYYEWVE